jgi:predicted DNA-binding ribbon-helix-helix protein
MYASLDDVNVAQFGSGEQEALTASVLHSLRESMYTNRMLVAPRRINQIAREEVTSFMRYLAVENADQIRSRGIQLAEEGLGQRAVVNMASALRLACLNSTNQTDELFRIADLVEAYTRALLDGYCAGYEEALRREQQRTHEAYVRSVTPV